MHNLCDRFEILFRDLTFNEQICTYVISTNKNMLKNELRFGEHSPKVCSGMFSLLSQIIKNQMVRIRDLLITEPILREEWPHTM